jgi:hypothetical protein
LLGFLGLKIGYTECNFISAMRAREAEHAP